MSLPAQCGRNQVVINCDLLTILRLKGAATAQRAIRTTVNRQNFNFMIRRVKGLKCIFTG
jgi:hypothetical protein